MLLARKPRFAVLTLALLPLLSGLSVQQPVPGRIFFAARIGSDRGWSIVSVRPDGSDQRTEVAYAGGQGEYNPAVSTDGNTIYFNSYRYGGWKLARVTRGSSAPARITQGSDYYTNVDSSPDGSLLLYELNRPNGNDIMLARADGSGERNLTASLGAGEEHVPSWFPDGNAFVFFGDREGRQQIYRASLDGSPVANLSRNTGNDFAPAVSPDGRSIAFYSDRDGFLDVMVMASDGTNVRNVSAAFRGRATRWSYSGRTYWPFKLSWSPDGRKVVAVAEEGEGTVLRQYPIDGTAPLQMSVGVLSPITPTWANTP